MTDVIEKLTLLPHGFPILLWRHAQVLRKYCCHVALATETQSRVSSMSEVFA